MKMKYVLVLSLVLFNLPGYAQKIKTKPGISVSLDPGLGKTLLKQCSRATPKAVTSYWLVSQTDMDSLEQNFSNIDSLRAKDCCLMGGQIKKIDDYGVQYIGVVIKKRRYIYINAFPIREIEFMKKYEPTFDPTKKPVVVCDGGSNFWGALFDVETKEFSSLSFNGIG